MSKYSINDKVIVKSSNKYGKVVNVDHGFPTLYLVKHGETYKSYSESDLIDEVLIRDLEEESFLNYVMVCFSLLILTFFGLVATKLIVEGPTNVHTSINR